MPIQTSQFYRTSLKGLSDGQFIDLSKYRFTAGYFLAAMPALHNYESSILENKDLFLLYGDRYHLIL